jgi:hypothetical protein
MVTDLTLGIRLPKLWIPDGQRRQRFCVLVAGEPPLNEEMFATTSYVRSSSFLY